MRGNAGQNVVVADERRRRSAVSCGEHVAAIEQHGGGARLARQHLVEGDKRVLETPQPRQHHGAIVERVGSRGSIATNSVADGERLLGRSSASSTAIMTDNACGERGLSLSDLADQLVRVAGTALLIADETEQMQRVELSGVLREHGAIDQLGLGDPALAVQHLPAVDGVHCCLVSACRDGGGFSERAAGVSPSYSIIAIV